MSTFGILSRLNDHYNPLRTHNQIIEQSVSRTSHASRNSFIGGKDSAAAWWWAMCKGWDVVALVTMRVVSGDSMMFQVPEQKLSSIRLN